MVEAPLWAAVMNSIARHGGRKGDWRTDGWTLVGDFLGHGELAALRRESDRLLARPELFAERGEVANSAMRSDRLDPVIDLSSVFAKAAHDRRLTSLISALLDGEAQLFKDKFIAKPPGAPGYTAHQDGAYWPGMGLDPSRFLTAALFLDDATEENGALECASGQNELLTDPGTIADPDESLLGSFLTVEAKAGDLLLLHALTPHRSGPNRSNSMRRTLMFTFGVDPRPDLYGIYSQARKT